MMENQGNRLRFTQPPLWAREWLYKDWFLVQVVLVPKLVIAGFNMQSSVAQVVIMRQLTKQFWKLRLQVHLKLTWRKLWWVVKNLSEGSVSLLISASDSKLKLFNFPMRGSLEQQFQFHRPHFSLFKVCLDYWNSLVLELFEAHHNLDNLAMAANTTGLQIPLIPGTVDGLGSQLLQRRRLYSGLMSQLRLLMIC